LGNAPGTTDADYQNATSATLFIGPSHGSGSGLSSRPFNPKKIGYTGMNLAIIKKLKAVNVSDVYV
jgi:hypothetical protein